MVNETKPGDQLIIPDMVIDTGSKKKLSALPSRARVKDRTSYPISIWGVDNLEPQKIMEDIKSVPALQAIFKRKTELLYGKGVGIGRVTGFDKNGDEIIEPVKDESIVKWLKQAGFDVYIYRAVHAIYPFENLFPEVIKSKNGKQVAMINLLKTPYCRWAKRDESGMIKKLFYNSDWKANGMNGKDSVEIPVMDEFFPWEDFADSGDYKMVYRYSGLTDEDKEYYNVPSWNAVRNSKWLSVAQKIPEFKDAIFDNQLNVKYLVSGVREHFEWKYPELKNATPEQRRTIMQKERDMLEKTLGGNDNAGKSIFSTGFIGPDGKLIPGITITTINSKFGSSDYIEDMQEATSHLLLATGVPATLVGISMGKKMGAGSGSDIREAYNMYVPAQKIYRDTILQPWHEAMAFNGLPSDLRLYFRYSQITTLDQNSEIKTAS